MFNKIEESTETFTSKSLKNMFKALNLMEVECTLEHVESMELNQKELSNQWRNLNELTNWLMCY